MGAPKKPAVDMDRLLDQHLEAETFIEISMSDIISTEHYQNKCLKKEGTKKACTKEDLFDILYSLGMDTSRPIEDQFNQHRNWKNEVVTCLRYVGVKRTDKEWRSIEKSINKFQN